MRGQEMHVGVGGRLGCGYGYGHPCARRLGLGKSGIRGQRAAVNGPEARSILFTARCGGPVAREKRGSTGAPPGLRQLLRVLLEKPDALVSRPPLHLP